MERKKGEEGKSAISLKMRRGPPLHAAGVHPGRAPPPDEGIHHPHTSSGLPRADAAASADRTEQAAHQKDSGDHAHGCCDHDLTAERIPGCLLGFCLPFVEGAAAREGSYVCWGGGEWRCGTCVGGSNVRGGSLAAENGMRYANVSASRRRAQACCWPHIAHHTTPLLPRLGGAAVDAVRCYALPRAARPRCAPCRRRARCRAARAQSNHGDEDPGAAAHPHSFTLSIPISTLHCAARNPLRTAASPSHLESIASDHSGWVNPRPEPRPSAAPCTSQRNRIRKCRR